MRVLLSLSFILLIATFSFAEEEPSLTLAKKEEMSKELKMGWTPKLKFISNVALSSSNQVVGQKNGDTKTIGFKVAGNMTFREKFKEWRNSLVINTASTNSPALPQWIKSEDSVKYETIYLKKLESRPWLGPYAKASVETSLFKGEDVRETPVEYKLGGVSLGNKSVQRLTDGLKPLTTKESAGFFAKLIDRKATMLEVRLGLGALQVNADGQYALDDDDSTATIIELKALSSYDDVGLEAGMEFSGQWDDKSSYTLTLETLTPLKKDDALKDKEVVELTNVDAKAEFTTKMTEWMNVSFEYKATYQPKLVSAWQRQAGVVVNFTYALF